MTTRHSATRAPSLVFNGAMRRVLLVLPALLLLCAGSRYGRSEPTSYALVIGVSDYLEYGDEPGGDLPGAVNDAHAFRDVLVGRLGVPAANIHLLLDGAAKRADIEREFASWLPSVVREGDVVWVFYAGHGSQTWDQDMDEADGMDETICPVDAGRSTFDFDIVDDEIDRWIAALPTASVFLVWDKCHAESSMRSSVPNARARVLGRALTDMPKPVGLRERREGRALGSRNESGEEWLRDRDARGQRGDGPTVVELAASRADQVAMDVAWPPEGEEAPRYGGAFTTNLVRNLWQAPEAATLEDVFRRTATDMRAQRFEQQPQLTDTRGLRTRPLSSFVPAAVDTGGPAQQHADPTVAATVARLPVADVAPAGVLLGAGAAAGVTPGSLYEAEGTLLRVVEVGPAYARAQIVTAAPGTVAPGRGAEATLVAYQFPSALLHVSIAELPDDDVRAIREAVADWPAIVLVGSAMELAHLVVRRDVNGFVVLGMDGFRRHRIASGDPSEDVAALAHVLIGESRSRQLAVLDNPAQPFPLQFSIDGSDDDLALGEEVRIRVRSGRDGFLTLVDLPADGTVTVVFPTEPWQDARIRAGAEFVLPRLSDPPIVVAPPLGRSMVRAFVTAQPLAIELSSGDPDLAEHILESLRRAAGADVLSTSDALPVTSWNSASIVYDVVE